MVFPVVLSDGPYTVETSFYRVCGCIYIYNLGQKKTAQSRLKPMYSTNYSRQYKVHSFDGPTVG